MVIGYKNCCAVIDRRYESYNCHSCFYWENAPDSHRLEWSSSMCAFPRDTSVSQLMKLVVLGQALDITTYFGLSPFPVILANEGLGWDPVLKIWKSWWWLLLGRGKTQTIHVFLKLLLLLLACCWVCMPSPWSFALRYQYHRERQNASLGAAFCTFLGVIDWNSSSHPWSFTVRPWSSRRFGDYFRGQAYFQGRPCVSRDLSLGKLGEHGKHVGVPFLACFFALAVEAQNEGNFGDAFFGEHEPSKPCIPWRETILLNFTCMWAL